MEDGTQSEQDEEEVDAPAYERHPNGDVFVRRADGSFPKSRDGRLTGPFGKDTAQPHQMNWSMECNLAAHKDARCRMVKTNKQLEFQEERLCRWLVLGCDPTCDSAKKHKLEWANV